eukprot:2686165-Amphidinium_carterae.1
MRTRKRSASCEQPLRKQVAEAKDNPDLKEHLEAALASMTGKKHNALPVKDQRAKLLAQAKAITTKMNQKLIQEALGDVEAQCILNKTELEEELLPSLPDVAAPGVPAPSAFSGTLPMLKSPPGRPRRVGMHQGDERSSASGRQWDLPQSSFHPERDRFQREDGKACATTCWVWWLTKLATILRSRGSAQLAMLRRSLATTSSHEVVCFRAPCFGAA